MAGGIHAGGHSVTCSKRMAGAIAASLAVSLLVGRISSAQTMQKSTQEKAQSAAQTTIKTLIRQVLLDVVVTDGKNLPVTGLKREDFSVTEDGTPQVILSFEARTTISQGTDGVDPPLELPNLPENTFLNLSRAREDLPLNVILYDLLNTPISDQPFARREIRKFLRNKPPGSRYAIFVLSDKLHLLQGVTDSEAELLAAMDSRAAGSQSLALGVPPADTVSAGTVLADSGLVPDHPEALALLDRLSHFESISESYFLQRRVDLTLAAFGDISQFLRGVPGRKNLLWLSGSFPLGVLPGGDPIDPFSRAVDFSPGLRQATNQFTLNQVAVYPVDIRGLTISSIHDAANNRPYSQGSLDGDRRKFWSQLTAEHDAMDEIAEFSGGHAFYNTNGFEQALHAATEDGANYYTLSYSPTNTNFDEGIRKIHVKVAQRGLRLSYRRNYFADDDFTLTQRAARAPLERTSATMERGAPTDLELVFSVHAKAIGSPAAVTPAQIADLSQFTPFTRFKKWDSVKMQRYELDFSLLLRQITYLITPDGVRHGSLDFIFAAYDADSNLLYSSASTGDQTV